MRTTLTIIGTTEPHSRRVQSAAQTIVAALKERLKPTSTGNMPRRGGKASVIPSHIPVADVLALYASDVVPGHARPDETAQRIERLLAFFGGRTLSAIDGDLCRAYTKSRSTEAAARRDLEELRAAINYHRQEGRCEKIVSVVLPDKPIARQHWLTRSQVARLLWGAWRFREIQKGKPTDNAPDAMWRGSSWLQCI
jgi:hypothetical protein